MFTLAKHFEDDDDQAQARGETAHRYGEMDNVLQGPWVDEFDAMDRDDALGLSDPGQKLDRSPEVQRTQNKEIISRAFRDPQLSLEDLTTQRACVMWRICRFWMIRFKIMQEEDLLGDLFRKMDPYQPCLMPDTDDIPVLLPPAQKRMLRELKESPLPLLLRATEDDEQLRKRYVGLVIEAAKALRIPQGAPDNRRLGRYGLRFLGEPERVAEALPTPYQLVCWEELLIDRSVSMLTTFGAYKTVKALGGRYGLSQEEAMAIVQAARARLKSVNTSDEESNRAVAISRLEGIFSQTQNSDPRAALQVVKQIAMIQGLTRNAPSDDEFRDIVDVMGEVIEEDEQDELEGQ